MLKATRRSAVLLALIAIGMLVLSMPSFAEVQNVKVGGDVTIRGFHRENLDLHQEDTTGSGLTLDNESDFFQQTTGINVGADLTENVSAFIRLANESTWGTLDGSSAGGDFDISQGYVKLKEAFYLPGDLTLGRQPIVWGRGMVLGSALIPSMLNAGGDRNSSIEADEFTEFTAFDAARLTIDLAGKAAVDLPVTVDLVYIKLEENGADHPDDVNLMGYNIGTRLDDMNAEVETYFLNKRDRQPTTGENKGSVSTLGLRGSVQPAEGTYVYGEAAYQFGKRGVDAFYSLPSGDSQQAWLFNLGADYLLADTAMTPKIGAEWIFWSGKDLESCDGTVTNPCGGIAGWDPIARGYFTTALREFQVPTGTGFYGTDQNRDTAAATNQHQLALYGSFKPIEDLTIAPRWTWFFLDRGVIPSGPNGKRESYAGFEWDTVATYDYSDDVQFGLIYALFAPGSVYRTPNDSTAQEIITSVSVKF